jgi:hypothetical protein
VGISGPQTHTLRFAALTAMDPASNRSTDSSIGHPDGSYSRHVSRHPPTEAAPPTIAVPPHCIAASLLLDATRGMASVGAQPSASMPPPWATSHAPPAFWSPSPFQHQGFYAPPYPSPYGVPMYDMPRVGMAGPSSGIGTDADSFPPVPWPSARPPIPPPVGGAHPPTWGCHCMGCIAFFSSQRWPHQQPMPALSAAPIQWTPKVEVCRPMDRNALSGSSAGVRMVDAPPVAGALHGERTLVSASRLPADKQAHDSRRPAATVEELLEQAQSAARSRLSHARFTEADMARIRDICVSRSFHDSSSFRGSADAKKRAARSVYRGVFPDGGGRPGFRVHLRLPKALADEARAPSYCFLGRYNTEIEAALVYDAAVSLSGAVFKKLNCIPREEIQRIVSSGVACCLPSTRSTTRGLEGMHRASPDSRSASPALASDAGTPEPKVPRIDLEQAPAAIEPDDTTPTAHPRPPTTTVPVPIVPCSIDPPPGGSGDDLQRAPKRPRE